MTRTAWNKGLKGYTNSGTFKKGKTAWNKGQRKNLNLEKINKLHQDNGLSLIELSKRYNVSDRLLSLRLKEAGYKIRQKNELNNRSKKKISKTMKERGIQPVEIYKGEPWNKGLTSEDERVKNNIEGLMNQRKYQVMPFKDTGIEIKLQFLLKVLGIKFFTHQYMSEIEHGYQCDFFIPIQEGIEKRTIIEAYGNYWHHYPTGRDIDSDRCRELREKGYRVLVFWENEINSMELLDLVKKLPTLSIF